MADDKLAAELAAVRDREQAATRGPWWFDEDDRTWRLHGIHATLPPIMDGWPEQVVNHQILKAPKYGTPYAEYWPNEADAAFITAARTDIPRLLAALGKVLELHQPEQLYDLVEDFKGRHLCGHDPDYDGDRHFEGDDGLWRCKDRPAAKVCRSCADESDTDLLAEWPCPTYAAILAELTGEEVSGD